MLGRGHKYEFAPIFSLSPLSRTESFTRKLSKMTQDNYTESARGSLTKQTSEDPAPNLAAAPPPSHPQSQSQVPEAGVVNPPTSVSSASPPPAAPHSIPRAHTQHKLRKPAHKSYPYRRRRARQHNALRPKPPAPQTAHDHLPRFHQRHHRHRDLPRAHHEDRYHRARLPHRSHRSRDLENKLHMVVARARGRAQALEGRELELGVGVLDRE